MTTNMTTKLAIPLPNFMTINPFSSERYINWVNDFNRKHTPVTAEQNTSTKNTSNTQNTANNNKSTLGPLGGSQTSYSITPGQSSNNQSFGLKSNPTRISGMSNTTPSNNSSSNTSSTSKTATYRGTKGANRHNPIKSANAMMGYSSFAPTLTPSMSGVSTPKPATTSTMTATFKPTPQATAPQALQPGPLPMMKSSFMFERNGEIENVLMFACNLHKLMK